MWRLLGVMRVFFFSSRRRHTILTCDWSSDVCSSDLLGPKRAREVLKEALASGLIEREAQLSTPRAKKRIKRVVRLVAQGEALQAWRQRTEACLQQSLPKDTYINMAPDNIRRRPKKSLPDP